MRRVLASQFRRNFASGLPATAMNVALAAAAYAIYLNYLGYRRFGLWLVLGMVLTETQIFKAGVSPAQIKLVAETYARGDLERVRQYIGSAQLVLVGATLPLPAVVYALRYPLASFFRFQGEDAVVFLQLLGPMMLFLVYILIVDSLTSSIGGLGRMDLSNYLTALAQGLALLASTFFLRAGFGIAGLLAGQITAYVMLHIASLVILNRLCGFRLLEQLRWHANAVRDVVRTGSWLFGSTLVSLLLDPINRVLLTRYVGLSAVPVYDIAFNAGMKLRSFAEVATRSIGPEVARIASVTGEEAPQHINRIRRRALLLVVVGCAALFTLVGVFAAPVLRLLLRARYSDALIGPVRGMLLASFFSAATLPPFYILTGLGRTRPILTGLMTQSGTSILLIAIIYLTTGGLTTMNIIAGYCAGTFTSLVYVTLAARSVLRNWTMPLSDVGR